MATLPLCIIWVLTSSSCDTDKYKKAAHGAAWYNEENEFTLNPFQKIHSRSSQRNIPLDVETGLRMPRNATQQSESGAFPTTRDTNVRLQRGPPKHVLTFPGTSPPKDAPATNIPQKRVPEKSDGDKDIEIEPHHPHEPSEDSNTGTTLTGEPVPQSEVQAGGDTSHVRKRRLGGILGILKHHENDDEKQGTDDDDSSEQKPKFTIMSQLRATLLNSYVNVLLILVPVGIALNYVGSINPIAVFSINFIAIIPLAAMLSYATEEIALRTGETIGGLLNATFGYI